MAAVELLKTRKMSQGQIARQLGVSRQCVSRWAGRLMRGGTVALRARSKPGRKPRLDATQWQELLGLRQEGALAHGFTNERWSLSRIAWFISERFGVHYHPHYLGERLKASGWSVQKPAVYARERDEELVAAWLRRDWPRIQKKLAGSRRK